METKDNKERNDIIYPATCLLLAVSHADDIIESCEKEIIKDIIADFFVIEADELNNILAHCIELHKKSTDLYEFAVAFH